MEVLSEEDSSSDSDSDSSSESDVLPAMCCCCCCFRCCCCCPFLLLFHLHAVCGDCAPERLSKEAEPPSEEEEEAESVELAPLSSILLVGGGFLLDAFRATGRWGWPAIFSEILFYF